MNTPNLSRMFRGRGPGYALRRVPMAAAWAAILLFQIQASYAQSAVTLDNVSYASLPGDRVQVELILSGPVEEPLSFAIDNPARVALDFPGVTLNLSRKTSEIGVGMARSVTAVEAAGRTRVVLNLVKLVPYTMKVADNRVLITLEGAAQAAGAALSTSQMATGARGSIENVDFRRGEEGEGRVIVTLSDPCTVIYTR